MSLYSSEEDFILHVTVYTAKKAHGIIVCCESVSMYREEISTVWKGRKYSMHIWK